MRDMFIAFMNYGDLYDSYKLSQKNN
jgi:hypothetical protein